MELEKKNVDNDVDINGMRENNKGLKNDKHKWVASLEYMLEYILKNEESEQATFLVEELIERLRESGLKIPYAVNTPYINTIPPEKEPPYPGNREIERRIKSYVRWNAMAMVVKANRLHPDIGGHISTYASSATLYEVGFNHFFRGGDGNRFADMVYFQGHASPGRLRARLSRMAHQRTPCCIIFARNCRRVGGLSSYPHPYLMPDFWQFPTVSMGLAPIMSIYQARFNRYLRAAAFSRRRTEGLVLCRRRRNRRTGNARCAHAGGRENLDNLVWVVNCNLQRLDGPVRGNGKIIQELEAIFRGAGWNVIKVIWGSDWDPLLAADKNGLLLKRMEEAVDGDYQKYSVEPGSYTRKHFFGKYPELLEMVNHLTDDQIHKLLRGGHDPKKVYAAYNAAIEHKGPRPSSWPRPSKATAWAKPAKAATSRTSKRS